MKTELEEFINENIDAFYSRTPDPAVLERIRKTMLDADPKKKEKTPVISLRLRWAVAACLIVLAGGVSYLALQKTEPQQTAVVTPEKSEPSITTQQPTTTEAAKPETLTNDLQIEPTVVARNTPNTEAEEDYLHKTVLFAKLTNKESPSERLTAASQIEEITSTDNDIVDVLAKTMNSDPNTNVRLAALDALSKFYREPYVKKKLLSSLQQQKDPMVQIALIELLTKMKEVSMRTLYSR
jgi:hypothetical protein